MNRVKSVMLLTLLSLILMAIGGVVGGQNGAMTYMFLISLAINFYTYWKRRQDGASRLQCPAFGRIAGARAL